MTRLGWKGTGRLLAAGVIAGGVMTALPATALHVGAQGTVTQLVFSPTPIGQSATTAAGSAIGVTLTAEDSTNAPVSGATVYLSFHQATGGGAAHVGSTVLGLKPRPFTTDSSGQVAIFYVTPTTYPSGGVDYLHAQDGATSATSTIKSSDPFCYSAVTQMGFTPSPIGRKGQLKAAKSVPVTLSVFKGTAVAAGSTVFVSFHAAAGGGSATVGTTALKAQPQAFVADSNGEVHITYTTPTTLPASGVDVIVAGNEASMSCAGSRDAYDFAA